MQPFFKDKHACCHSGDVLQKKVNDLNAELMTIKKEMLNAKGMRKKQLQQKAMQILKRRKMYDNQLGHV